MKRLRKKYQKPDVSESEKTEIRKLFSDGKTNGEISKLMGRSTSTISNVTSNMDKPRLEEVSFDDGRGFFDLKKYVHFSFEMAQDFQMRKI